MRCLLIGPRILSKFVNLRLSTFYHYIANININDENTAIANKKKFNASAEQGIGGRAEPRGQVRLTLGSGLETGLYESNKEFLLRRVI